MLWALPRGDFRRIPGILHRLLSRPLLGFLSPDAFGFLSAFLDAPIHICLSGTAACVHCPVLFPVHI